MNSVCFHPMYIYIFVVLFCVILYSFFEQKRKLEMSYLKSLISIKGENQDLTNKLIPQLQSIQKTLQEPSRQINIDGPTRLYPGGRLDLPKTNDYQLIGFLYNDTNRFPLYGRPKYRGKSDRYEYYIVDESRNKLQIPFKTRNDNELFDDDTITIPEIGMTLKVKLYEFQNIRYDPTVF
jgi:hypothetical protein